jgi:hypothetical protein
MMAPQNVLLVRCSVSRLTKLGTLKCDERAWFSSSELLEGEKRRYAEKGGWK